ncbi:phosphotransferase enzyme family-domain-containing protein [Gautieria morchelliformis]|nr:phosphotransferase enzyme family-domain-containing protein [Gautieria morchelliformis]
MTSGLEWVSTLAGSVPRWTVEPSIDVVAQLILPYLQQAPTNISFLAEGGFNKLYYVQCVPPAESLVMRVSLPVYPGYKTASEVATLRLVATETDIPVPRVLAFDASKNPLGFEWILMQRMPGMQLAARWASLDWEAKVSLVHRLADLMAQMFSCLRFPQIGNLFEKNEHNTDGDSQNVIVGKIVSMAFFWNGRSTYNVPRGPFHSSRAWLESRLLLVSNDCEATLNNPASDQDDVETAEDTKALVARLQRCLPNFFPDADEAKEHFVLCHEDISRQNILVDNSGSLTAFVDWECVSVLPLWKACQFPSFLVGRDRETMPQRRDYFEDTEESGGQGVNELYNEHVAEHELTTLRGQVQPQWVQIWRDPMARSRADVEIAIQYCDSEFCQKRINNWLDDLEKGGSTREKDSHQENRAALV